MLLLFNSYRVVVKGVRKGVGVNPPLSLIFYKNVII